MKSVPVHFHAPRDQGSVTVNGFYCIVAPVGEPEGPFQISIIKLNPGPMKDKSLFAGHVPISRGFATYKEAFSLARVGFELEMPGDPNDQSFVTQAIANGLILPFGLVQS